MTELSVNEKAKRKQRLMMFAIFGGLFCLIAGGMLWAGPKKPKLPPTKIPEVSIAQPGGKTDESKLWRTESEGSMRTFSDRLTRLEADNKSKSDELDSLRKELADKDKALKENANVDSDTGLLSQSLPTNKTGKGKTPPPSGNLDASDSASESAPAAPVRELVTVKANVPNAAQSSSTDTQTVSPTERPFLTSSTFVRAVTLTGLDAPTGGQAQSDPLPVFFRIIDKASLPNRVSAQIQECRAYGVAWGDLSDERAHIKLEGLSCLLKNGKYIDTTVKGAVIGYDGKYGIRGRLISKQGQIIGNAALAGIASGIGKGFSNQFTTTSSSALGQVSSFDGAKVWQYGAGQGVGNAMDMLAQYYIKAAEKLYPVIETDSQQVVDLVFTKPLTISGLSDEDYSALVRRNNRRN